MEVRGGDPGEVIEGFTRSWRDGYGHGTTDSFNFSSGAGRIYVTSPTFGVDLSVDWVRGEFTQRERVRYCLPGENLVHRQIAEITHTLTLEFGLPSLQLLIPERDAGGGIFRELALDQPIFLLDKRRAPPAPLSPLWLPKGVWCCEYCTTPQEPHLLQCRNCGAARIGQVRP